MPSTEKVIPVRVALRCRPLITREKGEGCQTCLTFSDEEHQQVTLGGQKAFTYDYVFTPSVAQEMIYLDSVKPLVEGIFKGYNATVLAYGQTGSGKTYTMGGGYDMDPLTDQESWGVIPRVIQDIFYGIDSRPDYKFSLKISYLEIYMEDLKDLLVPVSQQRKDSVTIRESVQGGILLSGLTEKEVFTADEMLQSLAAASESRTTGSTAMNDTSSRSHAIFTVHVERTHKIETNDCCKAKFHLVDLAGSERVKKTQAEGERFKEGVNINMGLLALGNVISALGEEGVKRHIPYRDSKLTRLLQDSLGGNSHTVMIACVSPADSNMEETLSTLRYADRARKIKNKPVVNRDPKSAEILRLRQLVQQLQASGASVSQSSGSGLNYEELSVKFKQLESENRHLTVELQQAVNQTTELNEKYLLVEMSRDKFRERLEGIKASISNSVDLIAKKRSNTAEVDKSPSAVHDGDSMEEDTIPPEPKATPVDLLIQVQDSLLELEEEEKEERSRILFDQQTYSKDEDTSSAGSCVEVEAMNAEHALKQARLGRELQGLNTMLDKKQQLVDQMSSNGEAIGELRRQYEMKKRDLESEVDKLQREKEELEAQLVQTKSNPATNKISEQRRQRLKELETQMSQLRKKLNEQTKMLKMKEQSEKQVQQLTKEIKTMKQQRVKLMKQIKEDGDAFRRWRQEKDKEVVQLKAKDRKRQIEMVKMERRNTVQQSTLRRKAEEAAVANRKLKELLQRQKAVQEERLKHVEQSAAGGIGKRVRKMISEEYDFLLSIEEAKLHKDQLIDDRKALTEQLAIVREKLDEPPTKRGRSVESAVDTSQWRSEATELEHEIDLRNVQISDLQQKIIDADHEDNAKWNQIHSMIEAKVAMKWLFQKAVTSEVSRIKAENGVKDMKLTVAEVQHNAELQEEESQQVRSNCDSEMHRLRKEYEDKVMFLMNQLNSDARQNEILDCEQLDAELRRRLRFQEVEIELFSEKYEKITNELSRTQRELECLKKDYTCKAYLGKVGQSDGGPRLFSPYLAPTRRKTQILPKQSLPEEQLEEEDEEEEQSETDEEWEEGFTPYFANRTKKQKRSLMPKMDFSREMNEVTSTSSDSLMHSCGCKGACATKMCACKKNGGSCGEQCKCLVKKCTNREQTSRSSLNTTFSVSGVESLNENKENDPEVTNNEPEVTLKKLGKRQTSRKQLSNSKSNFFGGVN